LIEPLSVVEKALATAFRLHEGEPRTALVIGAGPIGMLAALALSLRGLKVTVHSLQPAEHPRAVLLARAAIRYSAALPRDRFDIAIEAAGAAQAAFAALKALAPLGVLGLLGASSGEGEVSFLDLLVNNQKVFGSVNAGPEAFAAAVGDLPFMDARVLDGMIHRRRFEDFRQSILDEPGVFAKLVHVIE
jgi:threonine dehydrogenase-like Zn-dependent dehydrogenase